MIDCRSPNSPDDTVELHYVFWSQLQHTTRAVKEDICSRCVGCSGEHSQSKTQARKHYGICGLHQAFLTKVSTYEVLSKVSLVPPDRVPCRILHSKQLEVPAHHSRTH
ncbi:unnamed protein product [Choristocarpus tenellus]